MFFYLRVKVLLAFFCGLFGASHIFAGDYLEIHPTKSSSLSKGSSLSRSQSMRSLDCSRSSFGSFSSSSEDDAWSIREKEVDAEEAYKQGIASLPDIDDKDPENYTLAFKWLNLAGKKKKAKAFFKIGSIYQYRLYINEGACDWYYKAAREGHAEAQFRLGLLREHGLNCRLSFHEARNWYTKASKRGHEQAQIRLDWLNERGLGLTSDIADDVKILKEAAQNGGEDNLDSICHVEYLKMINSPLLKDSK